MNSNSTVYHIQGQVGILSHFWPVQPLVQDEAEDTEMLRRARIRSGDYLTTLATELEQVTDGLAAAGAPEAHELQRIVSELIYLEQNYRIVER